MKLPNVFFPALSACLLLSACDQQTTTPASPTPEPKPAVAEAPVSVAADKLLQSFGSAGPEEQSRAGKAAQAIRAENYGAALEILEHLLSEGHLTPEQKELVTGVVSQLQKRKEQKR